MMGGAKKGCVFSNEVFEASEGLPEIGWECIVWW